MHVIAVPADWPGPHFPDELPVTGHVSPGTPELFSDCRACGHIIRLNQPYALVPIGVGLEARDHPNPDGSVMAGAVLVHAQCAGIDSDRDRLQPRKGAHRK